MQDEINHEVPSHRAFSESAANLTVLIGAKNYSGASNALASLEKIVDAFSDTVRYPVLQAIIDVFRGVRHKKNAMEMASYPMLHMVLPMLRDIISELTLINTGVTIGSTC